jgi:DNA-binding PadR family transcriptional regulator
MFGDDWLEGPQPGFASAGEPGPGGPEGWQPWARPEPEERAWGGWWGGPWRETRRAPWGGPGGFGPGGFGPGPKTWHFARRFPFGPGMGPGPGGMGPRMFGRGDLKYALLDLLRERPKHGYEMIKDLEERSGGFYTPSAGAVYPTLQLLEDRGWVTAQTAEGRKVYAITDSGRAALEEHQERAEAFGHGPRGGGFRWEGHRHGPFGREMHHELRDLRHESVEVARLMRAAVMASGGNPERLQRLRAIVQRARGELNELLGQGGDHTPGGRGGPRPEQGPAAPGEGPIEHV